MITLTDYMCAGKKGEEERPALMIVLKHRYHDSKSTLKGIVLGYSKVNLLREAEDASFCPSVCCVLVLFGITVSEHPSDNVDRLYVCRKEGGRGTASIDDSIEASIPRLEEYIERYSSWLFQGQPS